jgi:nucleotide-binding universal stress UspA family protein
VPAEHTHLPVVVGIDGSRVPRPAIRWAARAAAIRHAPLRLVHVCREHVDATITQCLDEARNFALEPEPELRVDVAMPTGEVNGILLRQTANARLLVLAAHGRARPLEGLSQSTTAILAAGARCPVVAVPSGPGYVAAVHGPVVAGIDGSAISEPALAFAFDQASLGGAELVAVHGWNDGEQDGLAERLAGWQQKYPDVPVRRVVTRDRAAHSLLDQAHPAQLLVVGFGGRAGRSGLLHGSVGQVLLHQAPCPFAMVRADI